MINPPQPLVYGSVCSGIEAATVAWHPLGWQPAFFAEVAPFPRAVLQHYYPAVPLHGDFTTIQENDYAPIDLLVGGTPCQSFSLAGLRAGLADDRGNLALQFLRLAERLRPRWVVWENVPGVLSSGGGRDFGAILGGLVECGYGFAYRVLDAQFFGVPQRRRRVFVVGHRGDWRRAAAVLFERDSLRGDSAAGRASGEDIAPTLASRARGGGGLGTDFDCDGGLVTGTLISSYSVDHDAAAGLLLPVSSSGPLSRCLNAGGEGHDAGEDWTGRGVPLYYSHDYNQDRVYGLDGPSEAVTVARRPNYLTPIGVRRLTPIECEALQGFPRDYTLVPYRGKPAADAPRYEALGNSMAVPVMRWLGERIAMCDAHAEVWEREGPQGWASRPQPAPVVGPKLVRDADVGKGEGKGGLFT